MKKIFAVILSLGLIIAPVPVVSNAHAAGAGGYAKIVLGMANGIIGSAILVKCAGGGALQPSLVAYFSGSLVYVAAEVLGGKGKAKSTEDSSKKLDELKATMKEGGDYQKAAVEAQLEDQKSNLSHIQKKRKWMMATKVVYSAAAALAVVEFIRSKPPLLIPDIAICKGDGVSHIASEAAVTLAYKAAQGFVSGGMMGAGLAVATSPQILKFIGQQKAANMITDKAVSVLSSSVGRIAAFTAAAALVMMIDGGLASEEAKTKKQIADLEKIKAQFDPATTVIAEGSVEAGATSGSASGAGSLSADGTKSYAIKPLAQGSQLAKHCYTNTGKEGLTYSENCTNPVQISRPKFGADFQIPTLQSAANTASDMAQALSNGDIDKADLAAGNLASMASRIDDIQNDLTKKANEQLKLDGKGPIDSNAFLANQVKSLNDEMNKQNPGSGTNTLADLQNTNEALISDAKKEVDENSLTNISATKTSETDILGGVDLSKVGQGAEEATDPNADQKVATLSDKLGDYESNETDISGDSDVSIFKQVSNRYFLNYTKLFERKQIAPIEETAAKAP